MPHPTWVSLSRKSRDGDLEETRNSGVREEKGRDSCEWFTSVSWTAARPCGFVAYDGAIGWPRKTEADFRRWGKLEGAAGVAGPIGSPPRKRRVCNARGQLRGPNRPRTLLPLPNRPRTYRCHRDTLFCRPFCPSTGPGDLKTRRSFAFYSDYLLILLAAAMRHFVNSKLNYLLTITITLFLSFDNISCV